MYIILHTHISVGGKNPPVLHCLIQYNPMKLVSELEF